MVEALRFTAFYKSGPRPDWNAVMLDECGSLKKKMNIEHPTSNIELRVFYEKSR